MGVIRRPHWHGLGAAMGFSAAGRPNGVHPEAYRSPAANLQSPAQKDTCLFGGLSGWRGHGVLHPPSGWGMEHLTHVLPYASFHLSCGWPG